MKYRSRNEKVLTSLAAVHSVDAIQERYQSYPRDRKKTEPGETGKQEAPCKHGEAIVFQETNHIWDTEE